ncbi:MAG: type II/IV secretion system protein, partial [Ignavibacteriae bacterium]|nr:type II/IV secretion system protein [Ignavibacteriota bacterium]
FLIAYAINVIVAQRLIRTLCKYCKRPILPDEMDREVYKRFGLTDEDLDNHVMYEAVGCDQCNGGYKGRAAIHEALYFTKQIRGLIVKSGAEVDEESIRMQAIRDGMWTLRRSGIERIKSGLSTLEEIAAVTTDD